MGWAGTRQKRDGELSRRRKLALRAALLTFVWAVSGIWTAAHLLEHHAGLTSVHHVEDASAAAVPALVPAHRHGHSHPQVLSATAMGKAPKLEMPWLFSEAPELSFLDTSHPWFARSAPVRANARRAAARRPRAPPLS